MGTEIELYIGNMFSDFGKNSDNCLLTQSTIKLHKQSDSKIYNLPLADKVYIFGSDGYTKIYKDAYGENLMAYSLSFILQCLEEIKDGYNVSKAIGLIKAFIGDNNKDCRVMIFYS
jgi:hypothetical protein